MTILARLKPITRKRLVEELTRLALMGYFPSGCHCARMTVRCGWCREWPRMHKRIARLVNRLES